MYGDVHVSKGNFRISKQVVDSRMYQVIIADALFEPRREKIGFWHMRKTKTQISIAVTAKLISAYVLAIRIEQSLFYLNPKYQASSHLLWLYRPVCVGPGRKPRRPVFSQRGSFLPNIAAVTLTLFRCKSEAGFLFSLKS